MIDAGPSREAVTLGDRFDSKNQTTRMFKHDANEIEKMQRARSDDRERSQRAGFLLSPFSSYFCDLRIDSSCCKTRQERNPDT